ncbi:MAG: ketopantoate reductase family protein [Desulfurococcales archaeon]|nr:ketopantoate reductase family protein [Desulfurococcales archaeon]
MTFRIAIVGAGAMGHLIGGLLSLAGATVDLIDVDDIKVRAVRENGVTIISPEGELRARPGSLHASEAKCCYNASIILVKSYHTRKAGVLASRITSNRGVIVTLQNGLGNLEMLRSIAGDRAHGGSTTWGATLLEPGRVLLGGRGVVYLESPRPGYEEAHQGLFSAMENAGLSPKVTHDIASVLWLKAAVNSVVNPITGLLRVRNGFITENVWARRLAGEVASEVEKVARAEGIELNDVLGTVLRVAEATHGNKSSMLQDLEACRRTEADAILGEIIARGRRHGVQVGHLEALYLLVKAAEEACRQD